MLMFFHIMFMYCENHDSSSPNIIGLSLCVTPLWKTLHGIYVRKWRNLNSIVSKVAC